MQIGFLRNISGLFLRNLALKTKAGTKSVASAAALAAALGGGFAAPALAGVLLCVP